jgi:hypothetical protein
MSPRIKELDGRGFENLLLDVPDCDGKWVMADGSSVAIYMSGINPASGGRDLGLEFEKIQPGETTYFELDDNGSGVRNLLDNSGKDQTIKVELQGPLFIPVVTSGEKEMRPNVNYIPGVV